MIRISTLLILCLCGLPVLLFGCKQKQDTRQLTKPDVKPVTTKTPVNTPKETVEMPLPSDETSIDSTTIDPTGPPKDSTVPLTARQAAEQKLKSGGTAEEIDNLGVPK